MLLHFVFGDGPHATIAVGFGGANLDDLGPIKSSPDLDMTTQRPAIAIIYPPR